MIYPFLILLYGFLLHALPVFSPQEGFAEEPVYPQLTEIQQYDNSWDYLNLIADAGLEHHTLFDLAFEAGGTVWIAASDGLYRYDGYHWTHFTRNDGLNSDYVRCVCVTRDGSLWVGTDRGAGIFTGAAFETRGSEKGLAGSSVRRIIEDPNGTLWFCCDQWLDASIPGGLTRFSNGEWHTMSREEGFDNRYIIDFYTSSYGKQYAVAPDAILQCDNGQWSRPLEKAGFSQKGNFRTLIESPPGHMLLFSDRGVFRIDSDGSCSFLDAPWPDNYINHPLCLSPQGDVLSFRTTEANTYNLVQWIGDQWKVISSPSEHLGSTWIHRVKRSPDGSIWCIGDNILLRFMQKNNEWLHFKNFPPPLFMDRQNHIWFARKDAFIRYTPSGWSEWETYQGVLVRDNQGGVWNYSDRGIQQGFDRSRAEYSSNETGLNQVQGFASDAGDGIWFFGKNSAGELTLTRNDGVNPTWISKPFPEGTSRRIIDLHSGVPRSAWSIVFDSKQQNPCLYEIREINGGLQFLEHPLPPLTGRPRIHCDREGGVWVFSTFSLYWRPPGEDASWLPIHNTIGASVERIFENPSALWFQCNSSMGGTWGFSQRIVSPQSPAFQSGARWSHIPEVLFYGRKLESGEIAAGGIDHFYLSPLPGEQDPRRILLPRSGETKGIVKDASGQFWVGLDTDLYVRQTDGIPPETLVRLLGGDNSEQGEPLRIQVEAIGRFRPRNPDKGFFYSWRMDCGEWTPFSWLKSSIISLDVSSLPIGQHTLELVVRDEMLDVDPTPASISFRILPIPWQDRVSFWIGLSAVFLAIVWLALYALQKKIHLARYANRLENRVKERTASLQASEEKHRALIETTDTGYVIVDCIGRVLDANAEYVRLTGRSHLEEIRGRQVQEWTAEYDINKNIDAMQACIRQGFIRNLEIDYQHPDGAISPIEINASVLPGEEQRIVALCRDITERRRAEAERKFDELRLETLLHLNQMTNTSLSEIAQYAMEEAVRLTQSQIGYIAFANEDETILTMHAWSKTAMKQCDIEYIPVNYRLEETGLWGEAVRQRRPIITNDYSAPNPWKKGTPEGHVPIHRHMNVPIFDNDRIVIVAGVGNKSTDYNETDIRQLTLLMTGMWRIVQRKRAEDALKEKTEELDRFFSLVLDLLCIADTNGYFHRLNPQWENLLGYSLSELKAINFMDLIHPEDVAATRSVVADLVGQKKVMNFINRYRCKDGSYRWIEWNSTPAGSLIYAAARDITERRQAEEDRRQMAEQIQHTQKLESLGVLAGGIAHDFNNLLMVILGHADIAMTKISPVSPLHDNLKAIETTSQRAAELCKQMLAYSGKGQFIIQPIDLRELIEEMAHMLHVSISKKITLHYQFGDHTPSIEGDASQIRQVLMNLIINASEAIGDNQGVITVSTGWMDCDRNSLKETWLDEQLPGGRYVVIEVTDTGCGMDRETVSRIFDPFFTTKFTGRGLGLAAVLGIVRGHKGTVTISSQPGKGTTFKVLFPSLKRSESVPDKVPISSDNWQGRGTILLVDDEETIRTMGKEMLALMGFQSRTAANGREAVEIFTQNPAEIQCVILDLTMPVMDGEETFQELRKIKNDVRIILSSGYNEQEVTARFVEMGLAGFIQKPYRIEEIAQKLRDILSPR